MTICECYKQLGGSYDDVKKRLPGDAMIKKFAARFLDDKSFSVLCLAMENDNRRNAFFASHSLKGVCLNLGFKRLFVSSAELTKLLKAEGEPIPAEADAVFENVKRDYEQTVGAIRDFLASQAD